MKMKITTYWFQDFKVDLCRLLHRAMSSFDQYLQPHLKSGARRCVFTCLFFSSLELKMSLSWWNHDENPINNFEKTSGITLFNLHNVLFRCLLQIRSRSWIYYEASTLKDWIALNTNLIYLLCKLKKSNT